MPKERLHMLLARESLGILRSCYGVPAFDERGQFSFLLGSIFPDILFYDLPSFALSHLGNALHRLEGETVLAFSGSWLEEEGFFRDPEFAAWLLGLCSHFLADGFYHPTIAVLSSRPCKPCSEFSLSRRNCHHWLESEMEGYWVDLLGPSDGYFSLLDRFHKEAHGRWRYCQYFGELLVRAGLGAVPEGKKIARCLFWQTLLLRQFATARWTKWKPWLLKAPWTSFLGTLIVPTRSGLVIKPPPDPVIGLDPPTPPRPPAGGHPQKRNFLPAHSSHGIEGDAHQLYGSPESPHIRDLEGIRALFGHRSMARAVTYLANRLHSLPGWPQ